MCTVALSIVDAYLTLYLVNHGAEEVNPIMAFYLEKSPLTFFAVKYFLTCAPIFMILSVKEIHVFGSRLRSEFFFAFFILALGSVVQWQVVLVHDIVGH